MHEPAEIEKLSSEGRGLAHVSGRPCFITGALPGETIDIRILKKYKGILEAVAIAKPNNPSPLRTDPSCQHFLQCGGCSLQHIIYSEQLNFKLAMFKELWASYKFPEPKWQKAISGNSQNYRRKARVSLRYVDKKAKLLMGFKELDARKILDMHSCHVLTKAIADNLFVLQEVLSNIPESKHIPQLELVEANEGVVVVVRHLTDLAPESLGALARFAAETNWQIWLQSAGPDSIVPLHGSGGSLHYDLPEFNLKLAFSPLDFVQVNPEVNQKLVTMVIKWLQLSKDDRVLDLFCGLGNFSLPIAQQCAQVVGVEGSEDMVLRATSNAETANLGHASQFFHHDLRTSPDNTPWIKIPFNKVLLDPPRSGAKYCCEWLVKLNPKLVVYVSCNPKSMMNDLEIFLQNGYQFSQATIADMFPHTAHTEAIVALELVE